MYKVSGLLLVGIILSSAIALGSPPEIAHIHPDWVEGHNIPHVITGENFDSEGFELWAWSPRGDDESRLAAVASLGSDNAPVLPAEPPSGSRRVEILDRDGRVVVANLRDVVALWARNAEGWSQPYRLNVPRPFWLSTNRCMQGDYLHAFGFGMRYEHGGPARYQRQPGCRVALVGPGEPIVIEPDREGRSTTWIADARLIYFRVPADATPGKYTVFIHNGNGGEMGWVELDSLEVLPRRASVPKVYDARDFGATGDGRTIDLPAIKAAMEAAVEAGGGIVHLPPGTYCTDESLYIPAGVTLRGSGMENTILLGTGFQPPGSINDAEKTDFWGAVYGVKDGDEGLDRWPIIAALVVLTDNTGIDSLTLAGGVSRGLESNAMIRLEPRTPQPGGRTVNMPEDESGIVSNVKITSCRMRSLEEVPDTRERLYRQGIAFNHGRNIIINNNELFGSLWFWRADRMEIIRNKWYDTTATIVVSIHGWATRSILDSNIFTDTPGRVCYYPMRHCYVRYNEVHQAFKGSWTNAEEVYLVHGSVEHHRRTVGRATSSTENTLTDSSRQWDSNIQTDSTVVILSGKGMGQFRYVTGNTADTLTVDRPWRVVPDETSEYFVGLMYSESAFYANLNNTPLRMSLWLDCIALVVDRHRDVYSKGIDIWAQDASRVTDTGVERANEYHPGWYNMIVNSWVDGGQIRLVGAGNQNNAHSGSPFFANAIAANKIRQPHMSRTGFDHHVTSDGGIVIGGIGRGEPQHGRVGISHTFIVGNQVTFTDIGITISDMSHKTFIMNNAFQHVARPMIDRGANSIMQGNRQVIVTESGTQTSTVPEP